MPIYRFECKKCEQQYEEQVSYDETGKYKTVKCPTCKSGRKEKLATSCSFSFANAEGTSRWNDSSTGHDYRYKTKTKGSAAARKNAEQKSHMGSKPYNDIDDTKSDKNFDFSKI